MYRRMTAQKLTSASLRPRACCDHGSSMTGYPCASLAQADVYPLALRSLLEGSPALKSPLLEPICSSKHAYHCQRYSDHLTCKDRDHDSDDLLRFGSRSSNPRARAAIDSRVHYVCIPCHSLFRGLLVFRL
ncbi:uncharacterized protein PV09_02344 [Verruconis gallopava]|uniref:Uncharacterized protein n=1 Tax=Verruconis gallopava TaxID=253628 RepID=A0A0D1Z0Y9_9PEZI|nr:uncharacterized protein PV09_02344 [Verruconis gallopava]KIW06632.1 hypothetical protein PV09_02344 [Verruconis gallopava]